MSKLVDFTTGKVVPERDKRYCPNCGRLVFYFRDCTEEERTFHIFPIAEKKTVTVIPWKMTGGRGYWCRECWEQETKT